MSDDTGSLPGPQTVERTYSHKLSSDPHMCTVCWDVGVQSHIGLLLTISRNQIELWLFWPALLVLVSLWAGYWKFVPWFLSPAVYVRSSLLDIVTIRGIVQKLFIIGSLVLGLFHSWTWGSVVCLCVCFPTLKQKPCVLLGAIGAWVFKY